MRFNIIEMIRNEDNLIVDSYNPVKITKDKEPSKPEIPPPKRTGDSGIEIVIMWRRCIVCDYWRTSIVIIAVDY